MVLVNYSTRELTAKLVYYGPGLCGKTTNLQYVFDALLPKDRRGKMVSLSTETDRTLFFDFLPLELGSIRGLKTRLQLYTVPGQVHYNATRKIVLKGADGIVFVADSQASKREGNIESYRNMKANLAENGLDLRNISHVLQFNKRDLPDVMSIEQMVEDLNEFNAPFFEAIALQGIGVEDTLKGISKLVLKNLAGRFQPGAEAAQAGAAPVEAVPSPAETVATAPALAAAAAAPWLPPSSPVSPAWPAPAASVGTPGGDLEDMLLGAPPATNQPLARNSSDVFGFEAAPGPEVASAKSAASGDGGLEDMLLKEPQEFELDGEELELPTAEEEAFLRGDTVMSADMFSASPSLGSSTPATAAEEEAAFQSGDTMMSEMPPSTPSAKDFEFEAAMLSGDTMMSPSPFEAMRPLSDQAPTEVEPEPIALGSGDELSLSEDEAIALSADDMLGEQEMDLEASLLASPAPNTSAGPRTSAGPKASPAPSGNAPIDLPTPIHLGEATPGMLVERVLRVPLQYTDATGQHQTTLEVTLRFKLS